MTYKAALAFDNVAGLALLDPQPVCSGIRSSRYLQTASGLLIPDGYAYCLWEFTNLRPSVYVAVLTALGFTTAYDDVYSEITISTIEADRSTFTNFNAICIHKKDEDTEFNFGVYRRAAFLMKKLRTPA